MKTLLKIREFAAQEFLQNCYCLELLKVCKTFSIFDLVMCNTTAQKTSPVFTLLYVTCINYCDDVTQINYCNDVFR